MCCGPDVCASVEGAGQLDRPSLPPVHSPQGAQPAALTLLSLDHSQQLQEVWDLSNRIQGIQQGPVLLEKKKRKKFNVLASSVVAVLQTRTGTLYAIFPNTEHVFAKGWEVGLNISTAHPTVPRVGILLCVQHPVLWACGS